LGRKDGKDGREGKGEKVKHAAGLLEWKAGRWKGRKTDSSWFSPDG